MKDLKLMPEYECFPLWLRENPNDIYKNISPSELPITPELQMTIEDWDKVYQRSYNEDDPANSGFLNQNEELNFENQGRKIFTKLKSEIGEKYEISYQGSKNA